MVFMALSLVFKQVSVVLSGCQLKLKRGVLL